MPAKRNKNRLCMLENMENRRMFSTVHVTDYGAVADDGLDDTGAIIAAINASKPGDTIAFDDGEFTLSTDIKLASNRNYVGNRHAALRGQGRDGQLVNIEGDNVSISGLSFNGGGIFIEHPGGGYNQNINIDGNVFNEFASGPNNNGITFTSGLRDSEIGENYFTGPNGGSFGIYGYNYFGLTIDNNDFVHIGAGMHIDAFGNSGNLLVQGNFIHGARGMGMEFQGQATHLQFLDNWYQHPDLSSDFNQNNNSFAFSLILDKSSDILIKDNVVIAPERPDGVGCRIGFEVGGDNTLVTENYINGVNHTIAVNDGEGSCSVTIQDNQLANFLQGIGGIRAGAITYKGENDASTPLSWKLSDIEAGRSTRDIHVNLLAQS